MQTPLPRLVKGVLAVVPVVVTVLACAAETVRIVVDGAKVPATTLGMTRDQELRAVESTPCGRRWRTVVAVVLVVEASSFAAGSNRVRDVDSRIVLALFILVAAGTVGLLICCCSWGGAIGRWTTAAAGAGRCRTGAGDSSSKLSSASAYSSSSLSMELGVCGGALLLVVEYVVWAFGTAVVRIILAAGVPLRNRWAVCAFWRPGESVARRDLRREETGAAAVLSVILELV